MLTNKQMLDAVNYAACKEGLSYGKMTLRLTPDKLQKVYEEYAAVLAQKENAEKERLNQSKRKKARRQEQKPPAAVSELSHH